MQALKEKARIYVPQAVLLMGVMDEMSVLQPGELFLCIDPQNGRVPGAGPQVITGPVIMGRNPCFHPGDIRRLQVSTLLYSSTLHATCMDSLLYLRVSICKENVSKISWQCLRTRRGINPGLFLCTGFIIAS